MQILDHYGDAKKIPFVRCSWCVIAHLTFGRARGLGAPVTQWRAKKIHLQHEQSISAADLANQRFLGKQKSEREMCDRSRKRWLGGQRDRRPRPLNYYHYQIILQRLVAPMIFRSRPHKSKALHLATLSPKARSGSPIFGMRNLSYSHVINNEYARV